MDSRRSLNFALALVVLLCASFPILYPLTVAAAAYCERRLPRREARRAGLVMILAILTGMTLTQLGLLPRIGPRGANGGAVSSGWPSVGLALTSALGVWIVVARVGNRRSRVNTTAREAKKLEAEAIDSSIIATDGSARSTAGPDSPGDSTTKPLVRMASAAGGDESLGEESSLEWDHPTQIGFPTEQRNVSHLTYDLDAAEVIGNWLERTPLETFRSALIAANLSTVDASALPGASEQSTEELAGRLVAEGKLTPYQAVMVCAGLADLLKIDEYEVLDRLGRGGMAVVLRVRHTITGHLYALKLLKELDPSEPVSRNRFLREMEAVCGLAHPSIAVARSVGQQGNRLHIVMELVEGQNLAQLVAKEGPLPPARALHFASQAARALAHAHARGLVHRDVKPGNLMVGPDDQIKLVDMGLARFVDAMESQLGSEANAWHTLTGHLIGTIDYMAPEQAEELTVSDRRSDIYSLGCTLFFLLTGESHLRGRSQRRRAMSLVSRRGMTDLKSLRKDLPECLYQLVSRMTQLEPEARFQTMSEVIEAIDQCASELGVVSPSDRHFRVLMVEDSLTQSILTRQKIEVTSPQVAIQTVTTLAAAIELCQADRFDIILLDLNLPDSQGEATVKRLRRVDAVTPILVITSSDDAQLPLACIAAGADDFLRKSDIEPGMLQRHILLTIGRQRRGR